MKRNLISLIAIVMSVIAIGFSLLRIVPFEITNDTYIGIIATFVSIAVTMLIGYQIVSILDIKKEIARQRKLSDGLTQMNKDLNITIEKQNNEMQEGFDIFSTLINYQEYGRTSSIQAFKSLHHALISSLKTDRTEYDWIFKLLRKYIVEIDWGNFCGGYYTLPDGRHISSTPESKYFNMELKDIIKEETYELYKDEKQIRQDDNFHRIKIEYDRVMRAFRKRLDEVAKIPSKIITLEERNSIMNPL